ncbi:ammonia-dependent NAD(+) synthetase [Cryobacterium gelidum]|uniref:NH(3)-dependent NAD(+) synthetase n=1 Tax=Cryobacterium gelidum TaxID=1259164 RepID=A0A4R9B042_9MICO|nr:ammonia-dependent NAD(+) synthetase [Cryobacterium gelidum]TFD73479.1 ammonia-dependent NAD(+) synthetase [Cryobacterium gelidum]
MREQQARIIAELNVSPIIDPAAEVHRRVQFIKEYLKHTGAQGLVLGISGGQDSTLAGRLCALAVDELVAEGHPATFVAVRLPYAVQRDEADAQLALEFIRAQSQVTFNIELAVDGFESEFLASVDVAMSDFTKGNVKARSRMIAQYSLAGQLGLLVVGTDHAAEAVTGFFTKYGDGGTDILPLTGLTKRQGRALLTELGAPDQLYLKDPTADLLDHAPGQTDEANLGLQYEHIDDFLEGQPVQDEVAAAIESRYLSTEHKRRMPASLFDAWWQ